MPLFTGALHSLDAHRVKTYATGRGAKDFTDDDILDACKSVLAAIKPQGTYQQCFYDPASKSMLCDAPFDIKGEDIAMRLERVQITLAIVVTLGTAVDDLIDQAYVAKDFTKGILLDSAAAIALQAVTEEMTTYLDVIGKKKGYSVSWRWSPGTGDWPQSQDKELAKAAHGETIGVTSTESGMLTPRKSVAAFVGMEFDTEGCSPTACSACALAGRCHG